MLCADWLVSRRFGIFLAVFQVLAEVRMPTLEPSPGLASTNTEYYTPIRPSPAVPMKCNWVSLMLRKFKMHLSVVLHMARWEFVCYWRKYRCVMPRKREEQAMHL